LFHHVHSCPHADDDTDMVGERVLRETRDDREQKARLREIDDELAQLASSWVNEVSQLLLFIIIRQDSVH